MIFEISRLSLKDMNNGQWSLYLLVANTVLSDSVNANVVSVIVFGKIK